MNVPAEIDDLHEAINSCRDCEKKLRGISVTKSTAMDRGPSDAAIMVIGQAPGGAALRHGKAFAGNSFTRLHRWFAEAGFNGDQVELRRQLYLTSLLKCAPSPMGPKYIRSCFGLCRRFLWAQLELVKPQLILVLGKDAADLLLESRAVFGDVVGTAWTSSNLFDRELFPPSLSSQSRWLFLPHPSGLSRTMNDAEVHQKVIEKLSEELKLIRMAP